MTIEKQIRRSISRQSKVEMVLSLLRGDSIEDLCRKNQVAVHELFVKKSKSCFTASEVGIGRQQMEIELP